MTDGSQRIDVIETFARRHGEEGLQVLLLFKLIKSNLEAEIQRKYPSSNLEYDEEKLNELCVEKAQQLAKLGKGEPTKGDIKSLLSRLIAE